MLVHIEPRLDVHAPSLRDPKHATTRQRGYADSDVARDHVNRHTIRRQQPRDDAIPECLSISSHGLMSTPPRCAILNTRQLVSAGTLTATSRETTSIATPYGGSSRATMRSLNACPYRATA